MFFIRYFKEIIIVSLFIFQGCKSKDPCDDITYLPDLQIKFVKPKFVSGDLYEFGYTVYNSRDSISCLSADIKTAPSCELKFTLLYSATDPNVTNASIAEEAHFRVSELKGGDSTTLPLTISFKKHGYYAFEACIDNLNEVEERNEKNNGCKQ